MLSLGTSTDVEGGGSMVFSGTKTGIGGSSTTAGIWEGRLGGRVGGACDCAGGGRDWALAGWRPRLPGVPENRR